MRYSLRFAFLLPCPEAVEHILSWSVRWENMLLQAWQLILRWTIMAMSATQALGWPTWDRFRLKREMPNTRYSVNRWTMPASIKLLILPLLLHSQRAIHAFPPNISAIWCVRLLFVRCEKRVPAPQEENSMSTHRITVTINGTPYEGDVESRTLLVHWIRDTLRLTGTHIGCDTTSCGACTILV